MIVDLERNDLGRVCEAGSVKVRAGSPACPEPASPGRAEQKPPEFKRIEAHPTVWHLSATVEGRLQQGKDVVDLLRATFPGGSITGAPKIRAMEIIDELEPTRRGVFTGAVVWLDSQGNMGSNIAIRTIQLHDSWATFQVGGAIVWDSDPLEEYNETLTKARAMARALRASHLFS